MKKIILKAFMYVIIGYILGSIIFRSKLEIIKSIAGKELYYFLEEGNYTDKDILDNKISSLNSSVIDYKNNKFYIYRGITKNLYVANKIKSVLEEQGYKITIEEKYLNNQEFSETISQFDNLINSNLSSDEILKVEEVILSTYEDLIKNNSS